MSEQTENKIREFIKDISFDFGVNEYVRLSGDRYLRSVPKRIRDLWYSDRNHSFALSNANDYLLLCKSGLMTDSEYFKRLSCLYLELKREFSNLENKGKGGRRYYTFV